MQQTAHKVVVIGGRHAILRGIFGSIDADVMHYAETYFLLSALSYPFIGLYNAGAALFLSLIHI